MKKEIEAIARVLLSEYNTARAKFGMVEEHFESLTASNRAALLAMAEWAHAKIGGDAHDPVRT